MHTSKLNTPPKSNTVTQERYSKSTDSHRETSQPTDLNRATEHKCKLMLDKSPKSVHKKIGANRSNIFRVVKVSHTQLSFIIFAGSVTVDCFGNVCLSEWT